MVCGLLRSVLKQKGGVAQVIRNHGQPNPLFPKDRDLTYGNPLPSVCKSHLLASLLSNT
jgi:hypothetical protein